MTGSLPLVSVICLCYNHERFVREAVVSVIHQTYPNIQIIVADDASTDASAGVIRQLKIDYPQIELLLLEQNLGNCKAFNRALELANGDYIIDLAADDILLPGRIQKQVDFFINSGKEYGVVYSNANYIDETGKFIRNHFEYLLQKKFIREVPQGDIFLLVIRAYFIPSPTVMFRKEIIDQLNGYDENLAYEDFDFWVRSARITLYGYIPEVLTLIRKHRASLSTGWYKVGDKQLHSTYLICLKILKMCKNKEEFESFIMRVRYELRQSVFSHNRNEARLFFQLLKSIKKVTIHDWVLFVISELKIPVLWIRKVYYSFQYS
ncbi:MAG: glycosyltransferase [Cyclobacteriaceae bacterium]|jgi:glycosyltransferase involved in cell wall biosynthesis|nr:glycosyltransferase [Cyclobacteriaceae bacterium]